MLSVPEYGWTDFSIGDAKYQLSYLATGSTDWLKEAVHGLKNNTPFIFYGWCEPEYIFCNVTRDFCYIVCVNEEKILKTHVVKMTMLDFCKELHADVSKDTAAWAYFEYYGDEFERDDYKKLHLQTEKMIMSLLNELDALIKEKSKRGD